MYGQSDGAQEREGFRTRLSASLERADNYTGSCAVSENHLCLYGVYQPTREVKQLLESTPFGLAVEWREVRFTADELGREAVRLLSLHAALTGGGVRNADFDGLEFTTLNADLLAAKNPAEALGSPLPRHAEDG